MIKLKLIIFFISMFLSMTYSYGAKVKNINLKNPKEYLFSFSKEKIIEVLNSMVDIKFNEEWLVIKKNNEFQLMTLIDHTVYHQLLTEPKARKKEKDFGSINARFQILILDKNARTLIKLNKIFYEILIGEKYEWFSPDPGYVAAFKSIPSSTYFEYSFLLKLGELLGEKGMPPINDNPDGIRTKFYEEQKRKKEEEEAKRLEQRNRPVYNKEEEKESIEDGKFYNKKYQEYDFKE